MILQIQINPIFPHFHSTRSKSLGKNSDRIWVVFKHCVYDITDFVKLHCCNSEIMNAMFVPVCCSNTPGTIKAESSVSILTSLFRFSADSILSSIMPAEYIYAGRKSWRSKYFERLQKLKTLSFLCRHKYILPA